MPGPKGNVYDDYVGDWPTTPTSDEVRALEHANARPEIPEGDRPVMTDGQLGGDQLPQAPEYSNPEGSVDISNVQYREGSSR